MPYPDLEDSLAFYIDDGDFCCWTAHQVLNNYFQFVSDNVVSYGSFYAPDSLFYVYNCISPLGCTYTFFCNRVNSNTDILENKLEGLKLNISPNPANENLLVSAVSEFKSTKILIVNPLGNVLFESSILNHSNSINIDISNFSSGLHFLIVHSPNMTTVHKILIQN